MTEPLSYLLFVLGFAIIMLIILFPIVLFIINLFPDWIWDKTAEHSFLIDCILTTIVSITVSLTVVLNFKKIDHFLTIVYNFLFK